MTPHCVYILPVFVACPFLARLRWKWAGPGMLVSTNQIIQNISGIGTRGVWLTRLGCGPKIIGTKDGSVCKCLYILSFLIYCPIVPSKVDILLNT